MEHRVNALGYIAYPFGGTVRHHRGKENDATVILTCPALTAIVRQYIHGRSAKTKGLKVRAWRHRDEWLDALLSGYLVGDGHHDVDNGRWRLGFTRNDRLADDLRTLAARLGFTLTLRATTATGFGKTWPAYRGELQGSNRPPKRAATLQGCRHPPQPRAEVLRHRRGRRAAYVRPRLRCPDAQLEAEPDARERHRPAHEGARVRVPADQERAVLLRCGRDCGAERRTARVRNGYKRDARLSYRDEERSAQATRAVEAHGTRNARSVWTITTKPFSGWTQTARRVRVELDDADDDTKRTTSPDCPVHGDWAVQAATAAGGGRAAGGRTRTPRTDDRLDLGLDGGSAPTGPQPGEGSAAGSSDLPDPSCSGSATPRSSGSRRTDPVPATNPPCTASAQTPDRTGDTSGSPESGEPCAHTPESNIERDDSAARPSAQTPRHTADNASSPPRCSCEYHKVIYEETSHFATFPPELAERCIKAGKSQKGQCPECGAPWERVVEKRDADSEGNAAKAGATADDLNASGKWRNGGEKGNRNLKMGPVVSSETTGWAPTCDCHRDGFHYCPTCDRTERTESLTDGCPGCGETMIPAPYTPEPQTVLDPFGGSGTTAMVATGHGRRAILCELNPEYADLIRERCGPMLEEVQEADDAA